MRAAFAGHEAVCAALLRAGAPADTQDHDAETALHKAAAQGHAEVLALLEQANPAAAALRNRHGMLASELLERCDDCSASGAKT